MMPIIVNKLLLVNISAFGLSDILSHSLSKCAVSSYPETLEIPTMDLITSTTINCLVFFFLSESKGLGIGITLPYTSATFSELNNHLIW